MTLFNGLEEILKCVIENTAYLSEKGKDKKMPDKQRYHNVMKALFGDIHPDEYLKPPDGFTFADILLVHNQRCEGKSFEGAIKQLVARKKKPPVMPAKKDERAMDDYYAALEKYEKEQVQFFERIKKHYGRHKNFYERMRSSSSMPDAPEFLQESLDDLKRGKNMIFDAMRKAGWPI